MTLIIGIKCDAGIVVGADGAASLGSPGQMMTAMQPTKKLEILNGRVIFGSSGFVGLAQRIAGRIEKNHQHLTKQDENRSKNELRKDMWTEILEHEFKVANTVVPVLGHQVAQSSCNNGYLMAFAASGGPCLIQFNQCFAPESATDKLPYVALGSGQYLADPFLAFIRRIFWPNRLPTIPEGEFATWWTLHHAIKTATAGIGEPKQIMALQKSGADYLPKELTPEECKEHEEAVGRVEEYLADFDLDGTTGKPAQEIPKPPV